MNDTAGPKGLVPSLLVFGVMPRTLLAGFDQLPGQVQRMRTMQAARKEMSKEISQNRLTTALKSNVRASAHYDIVIGSEVFVYKEPPLNKWIGPFRVLDMKGKAVFVENKGRTTQLSVDKVKVYRRPSADELPDPEDLSVSPGTDNSRRRLLSPQEASDAWIDSLREPLQDLFSTRPGENAI